MSDGLKKEKDSTLEDLLQALESNEEQEEAVVTDDTVFLFIQTFNIEKGNHKVNIDLLYDLFKLWNKHEHIGKHKFMTSIIKFLSIDTVSGTTFTFLSLTKNVKDILKHIKDENTAFNSYIGKRTSLVKTVNHNFKKFIEHYDIKKGRLFIESDILYHLYDTWCVHQRKKSITYSRFKNLLPFFFETKRFGLEPLVWVAVHHDIQKHIDKQAVLNWRRGRKKREAHKETQKKPKEKDGIIYPEAE